MRSSIIGYVQLLLFFVDRLLAHTSAMNISNYSFGINFVMIIISLIQISLWIIDIHLKIKWILNKSWSEGKINRFQDFIEKYLSIIFLMNYIRKHSKEPTIVGVFREHPEIFLYEFNLKLLLFLECTFAKIRIQWMCITCSQITTTTRSVEIPQKRW